MNLQAPRPPRMIASAATRRALLRPRPGGVPACLGPSSASSSSGLRPLPPNMAWQQPRAHLGLQVRPYIFLPSSLSELRRACLSMAPAALASWLGGDGREEGQRRQKRGGGRGVLRRTEIYVKLRDRMGDYRLRLRARRDEAGGRITDLTEGLRERGRAAKSRYRRAQRRLEARVRAGVGRAVRTAGGRRAMGGSYTERRVVLDEPASKDWFDPDGYPRTSVDPETGRFVNPWSSQSTGGNNTLADLWRWRVGHRLLGGVRGEDLLPPRPDLAAIHHHSQRRRGLVPTFAERAPSQANGAAPSRGRRAARELEPPSDPSRIKLTWLGHAATLVQMSGFTLLTDPIFSERASAWQLVGPRRYTQPAFGVEDLPEAGVDCVLLSHDHYDHLDYNSVLDLVHSGKVRRWVVPLGIKTWLTDHTDLDADSIIELEWWQRTRLSRDEEGGEVRLEGTSFFRDDSDEDGRGWPADRPGGAEMVLTCAPAQHWCTRTPFDRNRRLWCSWAVRTRGSTSGVGVRSAPGGLNFYYAGDTGLPRTFPLHRQIGDRLGPFDLSAIPIGAYKPSFFMRGSHVDPYEAVEVHHAVQSRRSVGVHWGTFALADEPYDEPPRLLRDATERAAAASPGGERPDFFTIVHGGSVESPPALTELENEAQVDDVQADLINWPRKTATLSSSMDDTAGS